MAGFRPGLAFAADAASFSHDAAAAHIYPLSLHDALPISQKMPDNSAIIACSWLFPPVPGLILKSKDRKSTRLNSSHEWSSYAVFWLKKKNQKTKSRSRTE